MNKHLKPIALAAAVSIGVALLMIGTIQLCCWLAGVELTGHGASFSATLGSMISLMAGGFIGLIEYAGWKSE